ncbi:O-acetyl-ADP-ribose deacetylase [Neoactinobaculum massilliense]|uniref:O-acetyl-ADP-ribose deacetylase n=1 Tax=Neoactinobaculum massilliense TaxID=2364794 RepID=UPI000F52E848|nr:O-acetyl-ADP-ribose deacetylase [Neoactinobaculum massilliense]
MAQIELIEGDITTLNVDAIVNAANSALAGGGGVDGAIHDAAGPELDAACQQLRRTTLPAGLPVGQAVATPGFRLPARLIIHTVGPNVHRGQRNPADLRSAFTESLRVAEKSGAVSLAFPAISGGVYGWPMAEVARIGLEVARAYSGPVERIVFCLYSASDLAVWQQVAAAGE